MDNRRDFKLVGESEGEREREIERERERVSERTEITLRGVRKAKKTKKKFLIKMKKKMTVKCGVE